MLQVESKLPHVGTTIFTVISQRAQELGAINLAQGFPNYEPPARLRALIASHLERGHNQYAPMIGVQSLREQIAGAYGRRYGRPVDADKYFINASGATERPAPDFRIDWQRLRDALSARTRLIIVNNPHNPTGAVLSRDDLETLAGLLRNSPTMVLSDEVYEHMTFDGRSHFSLQGHAELAERSLSVYSFGKPLHATGYRVGYAIGPVNITQELRRVHQFNTFTITTPLQHAIADFMAESARHFAELPDFYARKRDRFLHALQGSRWRWTPTPGTYFQLLDYAEISRAPDTEVADWMLREIGVAAIPLSPFYETPPVHTYLRFCFAKLEATLDQAAEKLCRI